MRRSLGIFLALLVALLCGSSGAKPAASILHRPCSSVCYDYDAFGNVISQSGATPNTRLFSGEEFDPDLGLQYLRARYRDPQRGRFWTRDTYPGDSRVNRYQANRARIQRL